MRRLTDWLNSVEWSIKFQLKQSSEEGFQSQKNGRSHKGKGLEGGCGKTVSFSFFFFFSKIS